MEAILFSRQQARRFLLRKHGLLGEHRFIGKNGVLEFVRQAGCIQFDPVDVCGKNPELVLQSRIQGFTKQMLYELLYEERVLVDYFDKNLAIIEMQDWPYFECYRAQHRHRERSHAEIDQVRCSIRQTIAERGAMCSGDIDLPGKVHWYWSDTKLSRAALEHMYFCGELAIHHKIGAVKYYDLAENCIPQKLLCSPDPYPDAHMHRKWRVLRRVGAVGLLWNRASDAWLGIDGLKSAERTEIFTELQGERKILEVHVEGLRDTLYMRAEDAALAQECTQAKAWKQRCEFLAPLDSLLWDRKLFATLFDFEYKWEIYTPAEQRKYGHYVLPILYGDCVIGRIEACANRKASVLTVKNIWLEADTKRTKALDSALNRSVKRLAAFNACSTLSDESGYFSSEE